MQIASPQAMFDLWEQLAQSNKVLLLYWDLWAGKTTLIKWFAKGLGIDENSVQSPTYAYVNIYNNLLLHIDMYRLSSFEEMVEKWILNQISEYEYIVIEWPKREEKLDLDNPEKIEIIKTSSSTREVKKKP